MQVLAVRLADLRYLFPQLGDALFDGLLHGDRLAEHAHLRVGKQQYCPIPDTAIRSHCCSLNLVSFPLGRRLAQQDAPDR